MIAYSIEQALQTPEITRVIVSTDDDEIAGVAATGGRKSIHAPAKIRTGFGH